MFALRDMIRTKAVAVHSRLGGIGPSTKTTAHKSESLSPYIHQIIPVVFLIRYCLSVAPFIKNLYFLRTTDRSSTAWNKAVLCTGDARQFE